MFVPAPSFSSEEKRGDTPVSAAPIALSSFRCYPLYEVGKYRK